jgi:hypothetical protein
MQVLHKGYNVIIKVKVLHSMLDCLCMPMLIKLKNTNVEGLKNMRKVAKERIQMYI